MAVLIPPAAVLAPASLAGLVQLVTPMIRLPAVPPVALDGLVQFVIGFGNALLAMLVAISVGPRRPCKRQNSRKRGCGEKHAAERLSPSLLQCHGSLLCRF